MKFNPLTPEEIDRMGLLPDNTYEAEILVCDEKVDSKGRDMLAIKLNIVDDTGNSHHIYDHCSPHWGGFAKKFREFFVSMGKLDMYESGNIDTALIVGQYVTANVASEQSEGYPVKNVVVEYVERTLADAIKKKPEILAKAKKEAEAPNSDLPF